MSNTHGSLSINSDNIFPIIKKWMYSDHDIFYRELISNGCDAITKLKKLDMIGEYEAPDDIEYKIDVKVSANNKTIKIIDNGIGMTYDEVNDNLGTIAKSGTLAFVKKLEEAKENAGPHSQICRRVSVFAGKIQENRSGFLGRFKEARGKIEIPPGSFSFASVFFWRSKRKC